MLTTSKKYLHNNIYTGIDQKMGVSLAKSTHKITHNKQLYFPNKWQEKKRVKERGVFNQFYKRQKSRKTEAKNKKTNIKHKV